MPLTQKNLIGTGGSFFLDLDAGSKLARFYWSLLIFPRAYLGETHTGAPAERVRPCRMFVF
jgi:hypothetical protein